MVLQTLSARGMTCYSSRPLIPNSAGKAIDNSALYQNLRKSFRLLILLFFFFLLLFAFLLLLALVFAFLSAFVSHGVSPFRLRFKLRRHHDPATAGRKLGEFHI